MRLTAEQIKQDEATAEKIIDLLPDDPNRAIYVMVLTVAAVAHGQAREIESVLRAVRHLHAQMVAMLAEEAADQSEHRHAH